MYCPQCLTEYREGFSTCVDCQVPLLPGKPPEGPAKDAPPELVTVLETADAFAIGLAKASLEDAGIEFEIEGGDRGSRRTMGMTGAEGHALYTVQVAREDEAAARELMEPLANPETDLQETDGGEAAE